MGKLVGFKSAAAVAVAVVAVSAVTVALADNTVADGDGVTPVANQNMALETIPCGVETRRDVPIAISRNGAAGSTNVFKNSSTATVSVLSVSGAGVSASVPAAPDNEISIPSDWSTQANNTLTTDIVTATVRVTPTSTGSGSGSVTFRATGKNSSDATINRDDPMNVTWNAGSCDTTPPEIIPNVQGTEGDNGWYTSNVTLTWNVSDPESAISSQTGCGETNITSDQQSVDYTCSATSAGGTSSKTVSIKRDASAPNPACAPGPSGWQANNVVLACTAADVGPSGLANSGDASFQLSTSVAEGSETSTAQTDSRTVKDNAGNSAPVGPFSFMVDRKAPTVTCDSPAPSFQLNQDPANVTGTAADNGSGPASQSVSTSADTSSVGGNSVTLTASDAVGNQGSASCAYSVRYRFDGFFAPVDNNNVLNTVKAGQAIPLKWRLLDANNNPVTSLSSVKVTVTSYNCALATTPDALEEYAAGSSGLQNLGNGYYQFNWKSPTNYASSCKTLNLDLGEGSPRTALFKFTK